MRTDYYNNHRNADYFTDNAPSPASVPARPTKPQAHATTPQKIAPKAQPARADAKHSATVSMHSIMDDTTKLAQQAENCVKQAWHDVEKTATHAWHHPKQDALKFADDVGQLDIGEVKEAWNAGIHTLDAITGGPTPNAWLPLSKPSNHIQAIGADLVDIATLALPVAGVGRATAEAEVAGGVFETAEASGEITTQTGFFGRGAGGLTRSLGAEAVESSQVAARSEQLAVKDGLFGDGIGAEKVLTPTFSEDYGVALFGKDNIRYYVPDKIGGTPNLGAKGRPFFIMPGSDAAKIDSVVRAATETGFSPSTFNAWKEGGDIYGIAVPTKGLEIRVPTKADAMGWRHFLEGGHTAINAEGTNSFIVNTTREFVITGGKPMPEGSVFFRLDDNGGWAPIWRY